MGIGTVMANANGKKNMVNAVLCPGHLVEKWKTEILRLAPLSEAVIVDDFNAFKRLEVKINDPRRRKHLWLIFSKETAKFGYDLRPAAIWSKGTGRRRQPCYVCPECGNKRCPHANDHRNACTGSNEPGQEGSAYPAAPQQEVK